MATRGRKAIPGGYKRASLLIDQENYDFLQDIINTSIMPLSLCRAVNGIIKRVRLAKRKREEADSGEEPTVKLRKTG